eukprot:1156675-Pelagomonas_calceolata.AAC.5
MLLETFSRCENTATNWPVLRECGQEPLQFYWFRATVKFFNSMLDSNSKASRQVLKVDLHLADRDNSCWSAHVSKALNGVRNEDIYKQRMLSASKSHKQDKEVMRNVSRFRFRAHCLKVVSCKWLDGSSICDECECAEVQDKKHVLFYCSCFEVCKLHRKYKDLSIDLFKPLHTFAQLPGADFIPFLASFYVLTDLEINAFLNQDLYGFSSLLLELVSIFDAG